MALLYVFTVHKSDPTVANTPPSLQSRANEIALLLKTLTVLSTSGNSVAILFADESALMTYVNAVKFTESQQTLLNEWKAAYNISYTHAVYNFPEADIVGIDWNY